MTFSRFALLGLGLLAASAFAQGPTTKQAPEAGGSRNR